MAAVTDIRFFADSNINTRYGNASHTFYLEFTMNAQLNHALTYGQGGNIAVTHNNIDLYILGGFINQDVAPASPYSGAYRYSFSFFGLFPGDGDVGFSLTFTPNNGAGYGTHQLSFDHSDATAGNTENAGGILYNSTIANAGQITIPASAAGLVLKYDETKPIITTTNHVFVSNNANTTLAKTGDTITLQFTTDEAVEPPTVDFTSGTQQNAVNAGTITASDQGSAGTNWEASFIVTAADDPGQVYYTINTVTDYAGNDSTSNLLSSGATFTTVFQPHIFNQALAINEVSAISTPSSSTSNNISISSTYSTPTTLQVGFPTNPNVVTITSSITNLSGSAGTPNISGASSQTAANSGVTQQLTLNNIPDGTYTAQTITITDSAGNSAQLTMTTFVISGSGISSGSGGGDPYIIPMKGPMYKLPDEKACYRFYENGNTIINTRVSYFDKSKEIEKYFANNESAFEPIKKGYWFDKLYINVDGNACIFDLKTWCWLTNKKAINFFKFKPCKKFTSENNEYINGDKCISLDITWEINNKKTGIIVQSYKNPQIDNNIVMINPLFENSYGLCVRNYRPRLTKINKLTNVSSIKSKIIKAKNKYTQKCVRKPNETWCVNGKIKAIGNKTF